MSKKKEVKKTPYTVLKDKLLESENIKKEYLAGWQRARADFLNYKKDEEKRIQEILSFAILPFVLDFINILDCLEIAENKIPVKKKTDTHIKGLLQIKNQFKKFLEKNNVQEIDVLNKDFDPSTSEAVAETKRKGLKSNMVAQVVQKGYCFKGRTIRPAKVKITK